MPIVTDRGFHEEPPQSYIKVENIKTKSARKVAIELVNEQDLQLLEYQFEQIELITIPFGSFADGRGFSLARTLRSHGYHGRLRAKGSLIVDQYTDVRACGFDEVEIDEALASRQPEADWLASHNNDTSYQHKLGLASRR